MSYIPFEELGLKDFISSLMLWLTIEVVTFIFLPLLGILPMNERLSQWLMLSIPLGIGGAFLMGASSRFIATAYEQHNTKQTKAMLSFIGQIGGTLGFIGIVFPFFLGAKEFFSQVVMK